MSEDAVIPASADCETVELDIVFYYMLVVLHFQIVNSIFCIGNRINWAKLGTERVDKSRPVDHPIGNVIGVKDERLKVFQGGASEVG